jgi:hypothetical protein
LGERVRCFPFFSPAESGIIGSTRRCRIVEVGRSINRVDAADKVTGRARYTDDFHEGPMLVAMILHSTTSPTAS